MDGQTVNGQQIKVKEARPAKGVKVVDMVGDAVAVDMGSWCAGQSCALRMR